MKTKLTTRKIFLSILVIFILSCAPVTELIGTPDNSDEGSDQHTTESQTVTTLPATVTLTPLPTATLSLPLTNGTAIPQTSNIISPENVDSIVEIASWTGHGCIVYSLSFSPDSQMLASTSCDQTVRLWDLTNGNQLRTLGQPGVEFGTAFSPDGAALAAWSNDKTVILYDVASGSILRTLEHTARLYGAAISPDGKTLAAGGQDGTVRMWDLSNGSELPSMSAGLGKKNDIQLIVRDVAFSPDGTTLASADEDDKVRLWDLATGTVTRTMEIPFVRSADFSPDGTILWVMTITPDFYFNYTEDFSVQFFDPATGNKLSELRLSEKESPGVGVRWWATSPDGTVVALGFEDGTLALYNAASGSELRRITAHIDRVDSIAFSPDGKFIATGSGDGGTIRLWGIYP